MSFAERLREAMRVRGMGAPTLATKIYGVKDEDHIAHASRIYYIADAHPSATSPKPEEIEKLAKALNVSMAQLGGIEEITAENIRPYSFTPEDVAMLYNLADALKNRSDVTTLEYTAAHSQSPHPEGPAQKPKEKWQGIKDAPTTDDTFE